MILPVAPFGLEHPEFQLEVQTMAELMVTLHPGWEADGWVVTDWRARTMSVGLRAPTKEFYAATIDITPTMDPGAVLGLIAYEVERTIRAYDADRLPVFHPSL